MAGEDTNGPGSTGPEYDSVIDSTRHNPLAVRTVCHCRTEPVWPVIGVLASIRRQCSIPGRLGAAGGSHRGAIGAEGYAVNFAWD